jgi:hypothetical protein
MPAYLQATKRRSVPNKLSGARELMV